ncbi:MULTISPECIES: TcpD family membrane protein [unclassified Pseudonocardia]|uniref:TcpD family membrane protein n=1 Tax=unclassified Pseudonocardia TaxID=2619320 RepID=UPI0025F16B1D|nr:MULTISPECIES: TcpD family membrane protein [unclassified Pseudonocardia]
MRYKSAVGGWLRHAERWKAVDVKKIVGLLVIALLIFFVVTQPDNAANSVQNIGSILKNAAESVTRFFTRIV